MTRAPIRYIRVKDFGAGVSRDYTPAEKYLELANESLTNEVYTITTNERGFAFDPAHAGGQKIRFLSLEIVSLNPSMSRRVHGFATFSPKNGITPAMNGYA